MFFQGASVNIDDSYVDWRRRLAPKLLGAGVLKGRSLLGGTGGQQGKRVAYCVFMAMSRNGERWQGGASSTPLQNMCSTWSEKTTSSGSPRTTAPLGISNANRMGRRLSCRPFAAREALPTFATAPSSGVGCAILSLAFPTIWTIDEMSPFQRAKPRGGGNESQRKADLDLGGSVPGLGCRDRTCERRMHAVRWPLARPGRAPAAGVCALRASRRASPSGLGRSSTTSIGHEA